MGNRVGHCLKNWPSWPSNRRKFGRRCKKCRVQEESEGGGGNGDELAKQMEETEQDLVNKKLTQELIERQKQIMTRFVKGRGVNAGTGIR